MKGFHFALRLTQFYCGGEALTDRPSVHFAGQTEVGAVAWLAGQMTVTIRFTTAALNGCDGAAPKITRVQNLRQDVGTLLL
jgi:hypothetical protein